MKRNISIDFMRGLVMVIMALDHTRDLIHIDSLTKDPLNLATTSAGLFFTRWITHLCAPTFVFLSGTSAYLSLQNRGNSNDTKRFLFTRGLWLLLLEFTIVNFGIWFNIRFEIIIVQVIAAIGFGMIILSFLLRLSPRTIGIVGIFIVVTHSFSQYIVFDKSNPIHYLWGLLFRVDLWAITPKFSLLISYPFIPWLGILLAGYGFAPYFTQPLLYRRKVLLRTGLVAIVLFIGLRFSNLYGDPAQWSIQKTKLFTFLSFINVSKYPPSLQFVLLMLGMAFIIMWLADGKDNAVIRFFTVYGKVPLFYYIIHWYLIHCVLLVVLLLQGYSWESLSFAPFRFGRPADGGGVNLIGVYAIWLGVVLAMYPLCKRYGTYKAQNPTKLWLRYF